MTTETSPAAEARDLALRYYEAFNARALDVQAACLHADVRLDVDGGTIRGRAAARRHHAGVLASAPGVVVVPERVVAQGNGTVMVELQLVDGAGGTTGPADDIARGEAWVCEVLEIRGGLIVAVRRYLASRTRAAADSRTELQDRVDEHASLLRVADLVARGVGGTELFETVATEASRRVHDEGTTLFRIDDDGFTTAVASHGSAVLAGSRRRISADDVGIVATIIRTGLPARVDDYQQLGGTSWARTEANLRTAVGVPIFVDDRLWGALAVSRTVQDPVHASSGPLPPTTESRLQRFAALVTAALANTQARAELERAADEQAALRRVAELVARGKDQPELFEAVVREASGLVGDEPATLLRFEAKRTFRIVASWRGPVPVGARQVVAEDDGGMVAEVILTGGPARRDDYAAIDGPSYARREYGVGSSVGVPIFVEDRMWGLLAVTRPDPGSSADASGRGLPADAERRLAQFADIVGAAIANAEAHEQLRASRARVVATADETRRRLQRDVHDGAQQRLVQTVVTLKLALQALDALGDDGGPAVELVTESLVAARRATADLRDLVRGILPASLSRGGLRAGLESLIADFTLPVELEVLGPRLPADAETTAYFVVAEALTNVVKHARAERARVAVGVDDGVLVIVVEDDGVGGAQIGGGTGLTGLLDRVGAGNGSLVIVSPPGAGTVLRASVPVATGPVPSTGATAWSSRDGGATVGPAEGVARDHEERHDELDHDQDPRR